MGKHHGYKHTRVYNIWCAMKGRCLNERNRAYPDYGGRGITVCDRWLQFPAFLEDMGEPPEGMSIERKDNDRGYEPGNCVWATSTEQALNRRSNHIITIDGVSKPMSLWADDYGPTRRHQRCAGSAADCHRVNPRCLWCRRSRCAVEAGSHSRNVGTGRG